MSYLSDELRREADAGHDPTGLLVAAAHAIDRLTTDLATARGASEAVVRVSEGLDGAFVAPGATSGAHARPPRPTPVDG